MELIDQAYIFAKRKHDETGKLYNGQPYIVHPTLTYFILTTIARGDINLLAAGFLHDLMEDCHISYEQLKERFNEDIANLVKEVTKDEKGNFPDLKTVRGLILKTADQLANASQLLITDSSEREKLLRKYSYCFVHRGDHLYEEGRESKGV